MPMIDALIPEGALTAAAEARLCKELTDILLVHEGFDPANQRAQDVSVVFVHRPAQIYVAGAPSQLPRYKIIPTVPEGQYSDQTRAALVRDVAEAVARAEGGSPQQVSPRVWVFPVEMPDGQWGSRGAIQRLPDVLAYLVGEEARPAAEAKLAERRRDAAQALLATLLDAVSDRAGTAALSP